MTREPVGSQIWLISSRFHGLTMRFQVYSTLATELAKISRRNPKVSSSVCGILIPPSILTPPGPPSVVSRFQVIAAWLYRKVLLTAASVELTLAETTRFIGSVARP